MKRWMVVGGVCLLGHAAAQPAAKKSPGGTGNCRQVVFEGDVKAGREFNEVFAGGLRFMLEPLPSGWIVRVLSTATPRGAHDYAELATPPYKSVSPLLFSTDWAFRAQDAVAWNPRRFRYVGSSDVFRKLGELYGSVMANDPRAMGTAAQLVASQPEAVLEVLDARIVPGMADQSRMASMVALNLSQTPHSVVPGGASTPLGRIEELRFRVKMTLPAGVSSTLPTEKIPCVVPTT